VSEDRQRAVPRSDESGQDVSKRRLTRAVRPEEAERLAGLDGQVDAVKSEHVAVALRKVCGANDGHGRLGGPPEHEYVTNVSGSTNRHSHRIALAMVRPSGIDWAASTLLSFR
jgi:hypothetical protein